MTADVIELGPVDEPSREALALELAAYRSTRLRERLGRAEALVHDGSDHASIRPAIRSLARWFADDGPAPAAPSWSLLYVLQRLVFPPVDRAARAAAMWNLASWTVLHALRRRLRPVEALSTSSDARGRLLDLEGAGWVELPGAPGARAWWEIDDGRAVQRVEGAGPRATLSHASLAATRRPAPRSAFGIPVFESPRGLGGDDDGGPGGSPQLSLLESLEGAHRILADCMPHALDWVEAIVPAFGSLGRPPAPDANRSETHEAGGPVFLGLVDDPMRHAEAVLHETQHQRYRLFESKRPFHSATDRRCRYASPWRRDLRPMRGIQLGLHAFVAVNELRMRAHDRGFVSERLTRSALQSHYSNLFAFRTIVTHDTATIDGQRYLRAMARVLATQHRRISRFLRADDRQRLDAYFDRHCGGEGLSTAPNNGADHRHWGTTLQIIQRLSS